MMMRMVNKFWNILSENAMLLVLIIGMGVGIFVLVWQGSVDECLRMTILVKDVSREYWKDADYVG